MRRVQQSRQIYSSQNLTTVDALKGTTGDRKHSRERKHTNTIVLLHLSAPAAAVTIRPTATAAMTSSASRSTARREARVEPSRTMRSKTCGDEACDEEAEDDEMSRNAADDDDDEDEDES